MNYQQTIKILKSGGVGITPTDTILGLVGLALNRKTVERIYCIRKRSPDKPLIILISSLEDLKLFGIKPDQETLKILDKYWPGKVSIILQLPDNKENLDSRLRGNDKESPFYYLHRGTKTLAFRLPKSKHLLEILRQTGPLVAPSANPEGLPPAKNITEAKKYFGDQVDFYQTGKISSIKPSTLIAIEQGKVKILREGAVRINI